jgi:hypothetical protein
MKLQSSSKSRSVPDLRAISHQQVKLVVEEYLSARQSLAGARIVHEKASSVNARLSTRFSPEHHVTSRMWAGGIGEHNQN